MSFTVSVPSQMSGHLDIEGNKSLILSFRNMEKIFLLNYSVKEAQVVDEEEMKQMKDVYLKDFEFIEPPIGAVPQEPNV